MTRKYINGMVAALRRNGLVTLDTESIFQNLRQLEQYHGVTITDAVIRRELGRLGIPSFRGVSQGSRRMAHSPA